MWLDGEPYTVVGVMGEGFAFPGLEDELWPPMVIQPSAPLVGGDAVWSGCRSAGGPRHRPG